VSNQVLLQLHQARVGFFEAMEEWREHPERFTGRPKLPGYKQKTEGRNLLVYEKGAIWKRELDQGIIAVSELGALVQTAQNRETVCEVRVVPKGDHYVIEVVYQQEATPASVDPALFVAVDLGVSVLAALTSNKPGFIPRLVNGKPIKSLNQYYNKQRASHQRHLAKQNRFTSRQPGRITTKRNRRIMHYLHTASRRIIDLLMSEGIGLRILGRIRSGSRKSRWVSATTRTLCRSRTLGSLRCSPTRPNWWEFRSFSPKRAIPAVPVSLGTEHEF
jgi:putative transposase